MTFDSGLPDFSGNPCSLDHMDADTSIFPDAATIRDQLAPDTPLFLDLETTSFHGDFCELGLVDTDGRVLINTFAKPRTKISKDAEQIHGISNDMVADAPPSSQVREVLMEVIKGHPLGIYNAGFDTRFIPEAYDLSQVFCVLQMARKALKLGRKKGEATLGVVAKRLDIHWPEGHLAHRAAGDAWVTAMAFHALRACAPHVHPEVLKAPEKPADPDPSFDHARNEPAFFAVDAPTREQFRGALFVGFSDLPKWLRPKKQVAKALKKHPDVKPFAYIYYPGVPKFRAGPYPLYALHEIPA